MGRLLVFGLGYSGRAVADHAQAVGFAVTATSRSAKPGCIAFDHAAPAIAEATHILTTAAPTEAGDPVLARYAGMITSARNLRWVGYLSSTVVYGNRDGNWVDEDTPPAPTQQRGLRRVDAEAAWTKAAWTKAAWAALPVAVDIFRLAGIYGPGRSAFDDLRAGTARRTIKPGHRFGRIHRDDIAQAVVAAMRQDRPPGPRVLNLSDDEPAESADVITQAAMLLGMPPPVPVNFATAEATMSPMARSFWAENRQVACAKTKAALGITWRYPTYREGLRAILLQESADNPV